MDSLEQPDPVTLVVVARREADVDALADSNEVSASMPDSGEKVQWRKTASPVQSVQCTAARCTGKVNPDS